MNYRDTIEWLFAHLPMYQRQGQPAYKADLANTRALLEVMGHPEEQFKVIHIAGTNGKGSVSHIIASILQQAGYKTGLYTSPHLRDFRERIRVNGQWIPQESVVHFVEKYQTDFQRIQPSFFEMTVGMAYEYFAHQQVDVAVLETGMGGRLDSTNISDPYLSIITHIDFDHTQFLGNSLSAIAGEKAGIIKNNVPVIIGRKQHETTSVFEKVATEHQSPLTFAEDHFEIKPIQMLGALEKHYDIWYDNELFFENVNSPLLGDYQRENIATAFQGIQTLCESGEIVIDKETFREGFENTVKNTGLEGRWQVLSTNPLTIADNGHNIEGIKAVVNQLQGMSYQQLHFVLGMVSDKNHEEVLTLLPKQATYYFCQAGVPRALNAEALKEKAFKTGLNGRVYPSVMHAYRSAVNAAGADDLVFVGGSTFVVAEVI